MATENQPQTALEAKRTFEQNTMERVRKDIGNLLPDDALKALVEEGVKRPGLNAS